jgi:hypothetical protein
MAPADHHGALVQVHRHALCIRPSPAHEKTWRIDAIPWNEHNTEAFAGLHNQGKRILVVFDEASDPRQDLGSDRGRADR